MCESTPTPLPRLSKECARCLQEQDEGARTVGPRNQGPYGAASCEPCRELAYRALCDGNDAAWDLLLVHLWPFILRWLYAAQPELTPTHAEDLGYRGLLSFRTYCARFYTAGTDLAASFPTFPMLVMLLQQFLRRAVQDGAGDENTE